MRFRKRVDPPNSRYFNDRVHASLDPMSYDIDEGPDWLSFRISSFAPFLRYSRFAAFSVVTVVTNGDERTLELKPSKLLLLPFAMACLAYFVFRAIGPIGVGGVLLIIAIPAALVGAVICESLVRTYSWWRSL